MTTLTFWNAQRIGAASARSLDDIAKRLVDEFAADIYTFVELTPAAGQVLTTLADLMSNQTGRQMTWSYVEAGDGWDVYGEISAATVNAPALQLQDIQVPRLFGTRRLGLTSDPGTNTTILVYHAPPREKLGQLNLQYILQGLTAMGEWVGQRVVLAGDFNAENPPDHLFGFAQITQDQYVTTQFSAGHPIDYFVCSPLVRIDRTRSTRMTRIYRKLSDHLPIWLEYH